MGLGSFLSPKPRPVLLFFFFLDLPPIFTLGGPGPASGFGRSLAELGCGSSLALWEGGGDTEGHDWEAEELGGQLRLVFVPGESLQLVIVLGVLKVVSSLFVPDISWSGESALSFL